MSSKPPKIHILFQFQEGPYGGANQFLKALQTGLKELDSYAASVDRANVVLFNANPGTILDAGKRIASLCYQYRSIPFIARLDGPVSLVRGCDNNIDALTAQFINMFASGIIYQSEWSRQQNQRLSNYKPFHLTTILNAPDGDIFYPAKNSQPLTGRRIRIIATSWSNNIRKGFDFYKYLDENLDFNKYEMIFVGNSPYKFRKIKIVPPLSSNELAHILRKQDIYLTASKNDPCSNSLIEALACGLPAVVLSSGGHLEIIQGAGESFKTAPEAVIKINQVAQSLSVYKSRLPEFSIDRVAKQYASFSQKVLNSYKQPDFLQLLIRKPQWSIARKLYSVKNFTTLTS